MLKMTSFVHLYKKYAPYMTMYIEIQLVQSALMNIILSETQCSMMGGRITTYVDMSKSIIDLNPESVISIIDDIHMTVSKWVIIPIIYDHKSGDGHYAISIFNMENRTFSIFDPSYDQLGNLMTILIDRISELTDFKYNLIYKFMDFQHRTNDYFCSLWSFLVIYLMCKDNLEIDSIVERLGMLSDSELTMMIGGFIQFVYDKAVESHMIDVSYMVMQYGIDTAKAGRKEDEDIRMSIDPISYLLDRGYIPKPLPVERIHTIYYILSPYMDKDLLLLLDKPMDMKQFIPIANKVYESSHKGLYLPIVIYKSLHALFIGIDVISDILSDISMTIYRGSIPSTEQMDRLREVGVKVLGLPEEKEYRIWTFILEFYLRYFFLDTYNTSRKGLEYTREDRYSNMIDRYLIPPILLNVMMYPPATYIDIEKFAVYIRSRPNTKDNIIQSFLDAMLQKSATHQSTARKRLDVMLKYI